MSVTLYWLFSLCESAFAFFFFFFCVLTNRTLASIAEETCFSIVYGVACKQIGRAEGSKMLDVVCCVWFIYDCGI